MNKQLRSLGSMFWTLLFLVQIGFSQTRTIEIRENQTSHLIFPSDILYTDIGDQDNFIVGYTNNILRVKGLKNQKRTNLTVITKDDYYYISYTEFGIREKRRSRKSALNEQLLTPLLLLEEDDNRVGPHTLKNYVVVFDKIAVPMGKQLYMELVEQGRNIFLSIPYNRVPIERIILKPK